MTGISTFMGIETALRGLMAHQQALAATGHNIANANTPGYSRQTVSLSTTEAFQTAQGPMIGTGVTVTGYARMRNAFLDVQIRAQTMLQGSAQATEDGLGQVENVLHEPSDTGLNSLLSAYWSSLQNLSNGPQDMARRQAVVEAAKSLADGFTNTTGQLQTIAQQTGANVQLTLQEVNAAGQTLQGLNQAIFNAQMAGHTPNDLLDQRDQVLDQLATLGNLSSVTNPDGTVTVTFDGVTLNDSTSAYTLSESGGTITNDKASPESAVVPPSAGKLGALVALRDTTIPGYQTSLDTIASTLIAQTNAVHASGVGLDGSTGLQFFSGTDASNIGVAVTASQIAAASTINAPGDNTNALALAALQDNTTFGALGGTTVDGAYNQLVTKIGADARSAFRNTTNAGAIVDSLQSRRDSISSVSLDEEMANLVRFQQGYQASARALSAIDDAIELLITRTGRVGL